MENGSLPPSLLRDKPAYPTLLDEPYLRFVVHLHHATSLHYDLRLECHGRLFSWAVPKGPCLDPSQRRYAAMVGDHKLRCLKSEAIIPPGHRGAGRILIWDIGKYEVEGAAVTHEPSIEQAVLDGRLRFTLHGIKLNGTWEIRRDKDNHWFLTKLADEYATREDVRRFDRSVLSGKTLDELGPASPPKSSILRLELDGFYTTGMDASKPLMVTRDKVVLDANISAQDLGVRMGMTTRAATNLAPHATFKAWKEEDYVEPQRAWLDRCVPYCDIIEPDQQHAAFLDLSGHPDPVDIEDEVVKAVGRTTGLLVRSGSGPAKWIARLSALYQDFEQAQHSPQEFLAPLPVLALLPVEPVMRERLKFLGYETIGEVAELGLDTLRGQFGEAAHLIQQAALGEWKDPVIPCYPRDSIGDRIILSTPVESEETLIKNLSMLAQRIGSRLAGKGVEGSWVELSIETESNGWKTFGREFAKPVRCPRTAYVAAEALWESNTPTEPVLALGLRLSDLHRVKGYQPTLVGRSTEENRAVRLQRAVNQLQTTYGEGAVLRASQVAIPRRVRVLQEWQHVLGWR